PEHGRGEATDLQRPLDPEELGFRRDLVRLPVQLDRDDHPQPRAAVRVQQRPAGGRHRQPRRLQRLRLRRDGPARGHLLHQVAGPPAPAPAAAGVNGLTNPGLENSADGAVPTCWLPSGYGTNSATFARVSGAHSGSWAERITMTSRTSGDRKLLSTTDLGECS